MDSEKSRLATEEILRRYEFIINTSRDWHTLINRNYIYEAANRAFCTAHQKEWEEIIGTTVSRMWGAETFKNTIKGKLDRCFEGHEVNYQVWFEMPMEGHQYFDVTYYPYKTENNTVSHVVVVTRNITRNKKADEAKRKLEIELQQARKIEALSTLSGGIAHEFNNALMVVAGHIELLQMTEPENGAVKSFAKSTNDSIYRMSNLTQQLLAYAREGDVRLKKINLSKLVKSVLPQIQKGIDHSVRIETELMNNIPEIKADPNQLQMIISSIVDNSSEAIENKGKIRIVTSHEEISRAFSAEHPGLTPGGFVCLTVEDNGKGMDQETQNRIFDPFFTTKFQGRGLGMAAVYGIIKNHRGYIYVESKPGKGSVVRILLPPAYTEARQRPERPVKFMPQTYTILVIDDEERVLNTIKSLIEQVGYTVLGANTAKKAIELARTYEGQIDLTLLDVKLPDMEGGTLYPLLMQARPKMKVIVCSGYSLDSGVKQILKAGAQGFLQKPFAFKTISAKLKEVLERR